MRKNLAYRLAGSRPSGYERLTRCPGPPEILMRPVETPLVAGVGVDGRGKSVCDPKIVVQDFQTRSETICGARGHCDYLVVIRVISFQVTSWYQGDVSLFRRRTDQHGTRSFRNEGL